MLEPVRKLPTNVGTRIRKCVYDALDKNPPDWARKILEHSISKEVYKGNASGPTKVLFAVTCFCILVIGNLLCFLAMLLSYTSSYFLPIKKKLKKKNSPALCI